MEFYPDSNYRINYEAKEVRIMRISVYNDKCLMWIPYARPEYLDSLDKWQFVCAVMYAKGKVHVDKEVFTTFPHLQKVLASKEALLKTIVDARREFNQWLGELMDELKREE